MPALFWNWIEFKSHSLFSSTWCSAVVCGTEYMLQAWNQTRCMKSDSCKQQVLSITSRCLQQCTHRRLIYFPTKLYRIVFAVLFAVCFQAIQHISFSFSVSSCIHCALSLCLFKTFSFPSYFDPLLSSIHSSFHLRSPCTHPPLALSCWLCCWGPMKQPTGRSKLKHMLSRNYGLACQRGAVGNSVFSSVQLSQP